MTPSVSVVIPAYNHARYLAEAIDSALGQTQPPADVTVVDDGSTDDTPRVLDAYRGSVRVVRQANRGVSAARNAGAALGRGDLLAFLDADDVWMPEKLAAQAALFAATPALGLVHCGVEEIDGHGRPLRTRTDGGQGRVAEEMLLFRRPVILGGGSGAVVSRAWFDEAGRFDESLGTSADWDLHHRIARRAAVGFVPRVLLRYRVHGANMHADVARTAREMLAAYAKAFAAEPALRPLRGRAYGGLHAMLAGSFQAQGLTGAAVAHGLRALAHDPSRIGRLLGYPLRRLRRSVSA
ncbi:MAG: glycosyltransferase family A protein [Vicinamibacteria bacterium]